MAGSTIKDELEIVGPELGDPCAIRVASLNLHTWQEDDAHTKLLRIASGMAALRADVLLLQEVGEHVSDPSRPNAGELVKKHIELCTLRPWYHAWAMAHIGFDVYREGLSILSSAPLADIEVWPLSGGALARVALVATTTLAGVTLRVASTHVTWGAEGALEVEALRARLESDPAPRAATVVAGDFNAAPGEPQVRILVDAGFIDAAAAVGRAVPTFGLPLSERIDYQLVRPAPHIEAFVRIFDGSPPGLSFQPRVSDHAGILGAYLFV